LNKNKPRRLSVALCGEHRHRTPLSYAAYRCLATEWIEIVDDPADAELLVFGFAKDIAVQSDSFLTSARKNSAKFVVLSEEPLWDTVWSTGSNLFKNKQESNGVEYFNLNHFTTDIFSFEKFPYFITTDDHYFARYRSMLFRNSSLSASDFLDIWSKALTSYAFVAEKRVGEEYDIRTDEGAIGLSRFRTALAEAMGGSGALIRGAGWGGRARRQLMPDWHLEKLADFDRTTRLLSAIENTCWPTYVTEKIFDCYATCSIPIVYVSPRSASWLWETTVNVYGMNITTAAKELNEFVPNRAFANRYVEKISRLNEKFMRLDDLHSERARVVNRVASNLFHIAAAH